MPTKTKARSAENGKLTQHPPGTIGVSAGEFLRYGSFFMSLLKTRKPDGTNISFSQSISIPENWNDIIRQLHGEWLWIQADDHVFETDALLRLLEHEVDVVVPLILRRGPPFVPLIFKEETAQGYIPFGYDELPAPEDGLFECVMAASGGMLVRKRVLDAICEWQGHDAVFEYEAGERLTEDFNFARKIIACGFKIHCDPSVVFGHIGMFTVWPHRAKTGWQIGFDMGRSKDRRRSVFYLDPAEALSDPSGLDWDGWRAEYDSLSFADQQAFYRKVADRHPVQQSFDPALARAAFERIGGTHLRVVELGGWDGALAETLLGDELGIDEWLNYDLLQVPQACSDPRYSLELLGDFPWKEGEFSGDVFVACHTIEHMRGEELRGLLARVDAEWVYLESPLPEHGPANWAGYPGSHILELGWDGVGELLRERGYRWRATNLWQRKGANDNGNRT